MDVGTGSGIFSVEPSIARSMKLPNHASVFQAEIHGITEACRHLSTLNNNRQVDFYIDSQAAIKAITSITTKSKLVQRCKEELKSLSTRHKISLCWIPGHMGIHGNEMADELARKGSESNDLHADNSVLLPISLLMSKISTDFLNKANARWNTINACRVSRKLWTQFDKKRTKELLSLNRPQLSLLIGILTGHNSMAAHLRKMRISTTDLCRGCGDTG